MSSLAHCFEVFGIHPLEQTKIRKAAKEYRNEGFVAQEANQKAVSDYIKSIEENHSGMVDQIRAELTKRGAFEEVAPTEPLTVQEVPKEALPVSEEGVKGAGVVKSKENVIREIARKDMEEAAKLSPEEFPILKRAEPTPSLAPEVTPEGQPVSKEPVPPEVLAGYPDLQSSAKLDVPPTAQHLELMPEEYPNIEAAAVKQDGKVYKDHTHINIVLENNLDPEKSIPGFVTKQGKFVEQYPKSMEDIYGEIEAIKNTPDINKTKQAHDLGKTLTRDQVKDVWKRYKERIKGLLPEKVSKEEGQKWLDRSFTDQMYRETVAGHLGEDEMSHAFTPQEIEERLSEEVLAKKRKPLIKGKNIPRTVDFDIGQWLNEHGKILTKRNPKTGKLESPGLDMTALSRREGANKAWGKYTPFAKAGSGRGYTFDVLFQELQAEGYTGTIDDALQQLQTRLTEGRPRQVDFADFRRSIIESDPQLLRDETINDLTGSLDDEIMGWKEEMREQGISEKDIGRAVEEATKTYQGEGRPPDLEAIKRTLTKSETTPIVKGPPTETAGEPTSQLAPQLKDLGYDDRQIARMRPDVGKEIVDKGLNADQVSITQDGYLAYITGKNKSILEEPKPVEETMLPARTGSTGRETEISTELSAPILSPQEVTTPGKVPISTQMRDIPKEKTEKVGDWSKGESRPFAFDPNSTENEGRFRLLPTEVIKKDSYFRRKSRTRGISYIMGKDKGTGDEVTQAIRFDKSVMPEERAAQWWEENEGRFPFYAEKPENAPAEPKAAEKVPVPEPEKSPVSGFRKKISSPEKKLDRVREKGVQYIREDKIKENPDLQTREGGPDYSSKEVETVFPEVISSKSGEYSSGVSHVTSAKDAAHIGAINLSENPQEHLISIVTDKNNKIISVYRHTIGLGSKALADQKVIIGQALNTPRAKKIWLVHNHPSGEADFSGDDMSLVPKMENLLNGSGISFGDFVSVGTEEFDSASGVRGSVPEIKPYLKIDLVERKFKKRGAAKAIRNESDFVDFAEKYLPEGGFVLLNSRNAPVSTIGVKDFMSLRGKKERLLIKEIEKRNAEQFVIYEPLRALNDPEIESLFKFANATNMELVDVVDNTGSRGTHYRNWSRIKKSAGDAFLAVPLALPFLVGGGQEDKKRTYPGRPEAPSYLPPGMGRYRKIDES